MANLNLINGNDIDAYLRTCVNERIVRNGDRGEQLANVHATLQEIEEMTRLMIFGLKRHLMRREESAVLVTELPADAPDWARNRQDATGPLYRFDPLKDARLQIKVDHVLDWLISLKAAGDPALDDLDEKSGKPKFLLHLQSLDDAYAKADEYNARLARKFAGAAEGHNTFVMGFGDGMKIVKLSAQSLQLEGSRMGHCVGGGAYSMDVEEGRTRIYSLRDARNEPHVTFEVRAAGNALRQCKGKQNSIPAAKYMPYVEAFVRHKKFSLQEPTRHTGLMQVGGDYHSIYNLPKGMKFKGVLDLSDTEVTSLPEDLHVEGNLNISGCPIKKLPDGLHVSGILDLRSCDQLGEIPEDLTGDPEIVLNRKTRHLLCNPKYKGSGVVRFIGDHLRLPEELQIHSLPTNLYVEGAGFSFSGSHPIEKFTSNVTALNIAFKGCHSLTEISGRLVANGSSGGIDIVDCRHLETLSGALTALDSLVAFTGCPSLETQAGEVHAYNVSFRGCANLKTWRGRASVGRSISLEGCEKLEAMPDRIESIKATIVCETIYVTYPNGFGSLLRRDNLMGQLQEIQEDMTQSSWPKARSSAVKTPKK